MCVCVCVVGCGRVCVGGWVFEGAHVYVCVRACVRVYSETKANTHLPPPTRLPGPGLSTGRCLHQRMWFDRPTVEGKLLSHQWPQ